VDGEDLCRLDDQGLILLNDLESPVDDQLIHPLLLLLQEAALPLLVFFLFPSFYA
jgi:hypothetical protein